MIDRVAEFYITINYKCAIEEERIGCVGKKQQNKNSKKRNKLKMLQM